jgi:hypothetical protein
MLTLLPYFEPLEEVCSCCASNQSEEWHCDACIQIHYDKCLLDCEQWQNAIEEERSSRQWP